MVSANKDDIMHLNTPDIGLQFHFRPHDVCHVARSTYQHHTIRLTANRRGYSLGYLIGFCCAQSLGTFTRAPAGASVYYRSAIRRYTPALPRLYTTRTWVQQAVQDATTPDTHGLPQADHAATPSRRVDAPYPCTEAIRPSNGNTQRPRYLA